MRTERGMENAKAARKAYNQENIRTLGTTMRKEDAERFKELAAKKGTTVGAMIKAFVAAELAEDGHTAKVRENLPCTALLSGRNMDRLKRETAFYNPKNYNPDEMLNHILDRYFKMAEEIRAKSEDA